MFLRHEIKRKLLSDKIDITTTIFVGMVDVHIGSRLAIDSDSSPNIPNICQRLCSVAWELLQRADSTIKISLTKYITDISFQLLQNYVTNGN